MASGLIIKVIIIVGLVKAIQSAIAYQREEQASAKHLWRMREPEDEVRAMVGVFCE